MHTEAVTVGNHPLGLRPSKIIAVHLNYRSRAQQRGRLPATPSYFLKPPSSLSRHGAPIVRPRGCELLTFEGEVAVVIGIRACRVAPEDALNHVSHYAAANDAGVYDLRAADRGSNLRSKGQDGYTPVGPSLVEASGVDPHDLRLRAWVNGELVQDASTEELLFPISYLIADLSRLVTLEPGDILLAGTPAGSRPVHPGDVVEVEIGTSGRLRNTVVAADHDLAPVGALPVATCADRLLATGEDPRAGPRTAFPALRQVSTATLSSQLRRHGVDHHAIAGLHPTRPDLRLVGFARTLRFVPLREDVYSDHVGGMNAQKRAVEQIGPDEVLVVEARGERGAGTMGDILALRALRRGAAGIVTDGGLRDLTAVTALDLPVYHAVAHPAVLGHRHVPLDIDVPVGCGGTLVMPGDVVVGDADGLVVIPAALATDVARDGLEQERQERFIADRVAEGAGIEGLYPMNAEWRDTYERWRAGEDGSSGRADV